MPPETLKEMITGWGGYRPVGRGEDHDERLTEVINLITNKVGMPAHLHTYRMREALTTSDFPLMFGEILDRQLLAGFKETPMVMAQILRKGTVPDFRQVHRFEISGGDEILDQVPEKGEYPASDRNELKHEYAVLKYGRQFDMSWETIINDDLGALRDTPNRFARAARRSEERFATALFMNAAGPLAAYFNAGLGGIAVAATALTIANLETGIGAMASLTDPGGSPILNRPKFLMTGPAQELTARAILTSATKAWLAGATTIAGAPDIAREMVNVVAQMGLVLLINPWIPIIDTTSTAPWYLFSDPAEIPAGELGHLRGHESPELFMKSGSQVAVGGGAVSPMAGDFDTDNIFYKVRHVFGGVVLSSRAGYASSG